MAVHELELDIGAPEKRGPAAATLRSAEVSGSYVGVLSGNSQNGKMYLAYKDAGSQRTTLHEVDVSKTPWSVRRIGTLSGAYYKDGEATTLFGPGGKLYYAICSSPDPNTGGAARVIITDEFNIVVGADGQEA